MLLKDALAELTKRLNEVLGDNKYENGWKDFSPIIKCTVSDYFKGNNSEKLDMNVWGGLVLSSNNCSDIEVTIETPFGEHNEKVATIVPNIQWDKRCVIKAKCKILDFGIDIKEDFGNIDIYDLQQDISNIQKIVFMQNLENRKKEVEEELKSIQSDIKKVRDWII